MALSVIPDELLADIFLRLPTPEDLIRASAACVSFRRLVANRAFLLPAQLSSTDFDFSSSSPGLPWTGPCGKSTTAASSSTDPAVTTSSDPSSRRWWAMASHYIPDPQRLVTWLCVIDVEVLVGRSVTVTNRVPDGY
uniref:Uncharacterized protein n=1 Tax=Aegilops tauschii TaxID=37682 RepID=M8CDV4_AEGTA